MVTKCHAINIQFLCCINNCYINNHKFSQFDMLNPFVGFEYGLMCLLFFLLLDILFSTWNKRIWCIRCICRETQNEERRVNNAQGAVHYYTKCHSRNTKHWQRNCFKFGHFGRNVEVMKCINLNVFWVIIIQNKFIDSSRPSQLKNTCTSSHNSRMNWRNQNQKRVKMMNHRLI